MADKEITSVWVNGVEIPAVKVICKTCKTLDLNTTFVLGMNGVYQCRCPKGHMWTFKL